MSENDKDSRTTKHIKNWKPYDQSSPTRRLSDSIPLDGSAPTVDNSLTNQSNTIGSGQTILAGGNSGEPHEVRETVIDFMDDPVAGWLVVIDGPGKGASLAIGYGVNSVGRAPSNRIGLNFGDAKVSRDAHCNVIFEPKKRDFLVQNGGGKNLTYLDDDAVYQPTPIRSGQTIQIGDTYLRFMAFCGSDFAWSSDN